MSEARTAAGAPVGALQAFTDTTNGPGSAGSTTRSDPGVLPRAEWDAWSTHALEYDALLAPITAAAIEPMLAAIDPLNERDLLDVACGAGNLLAVASARGARVTGLDASDGMVALARARTEGVGVVKGNASAMPFPDGSFDAITCGFALGHMREPIAALREAARVLRPGGVLTFSAWLGVHEGFEAHAIIARAFWAHGANAPRLPATRCLLDERSLVRKLLRDTGFGAATFETCETVSRHRTAGEALQTLKQANPVIDTLLNTQPLPARASIARAIERDLEGRRAGDWIALRWPFLVATTHRRSSAARADP